MMVDPVTDMTIAMEIDYFQINRAEYFVPLMVKIPGSELTLARKGGAEITRLDFIWEIKDNYRRHLREQPRPHGHQAKRNHGCRAWQAADSIRQRHDASARQLQDKISGSRL